MQQARKFLVKSPRVSKLLLRKRSWTATNYMPSWECVQRAALGTDEEWAALRIAIARQVKEPVVSTSDREKSTTIWLNKRHYREEPHGAPADALAIPTSKAIQSAIAFKDYKMVCTCWAAKRGQRQCHMPTSRIWVPCSLFRLRLRSLYPVDGLQRMLLLLLLPNPSRRFLLQTHGRAKELQSIKEDRQICSITRKIRFRHL